MGNRFRECFDGDSMVPFTKECLENSIKCKWCSSCINGVKDYYLQPGGAEVVYTRCGLDLERKGLDLPCERYELHPDRVPHYKKFCEEHNLEPDEEVLNHSYSYQMKSVGESLVKGFEEEIKDVRRE